MAEMSSIKIFCVFLIENVIFHSLKGKNILSYHSFWARGLHVVTGGTATLSGFKWEKK